jgi:hypothetical protein
MGVVEDGVLLWIETSPVHLKSVTCSQKMKRVLLLQFSKSFKPLVNKTGILCIPWLRTRAQQSVLKIGILVLPVALIFITSILS